MAEDEMLVELKPMLDELGVISSPEHAAFYNNFYSVDEIYVYIWLTQHPDMGLSPHVYLANVRLPCPDLELCDRFELEKKRKVDDSVLAESKAKRCKY